MNRMALVTGGSRGIDRKVRSHLAALHARVAVNFASNSAKVDELGTRGHHADAVKADMSIRTRSLSKLKPTPDEGWEQGIVW